MDALLVLSQVILSLQLGFAIIPLIHFVSDKTTMGKFVITKLTKVAAWVIASVLVFLNLKMLINEAGGVFAGDNIYLKITLVLLGILFSALLLYIIFSPLFRKPKAGASIQMHHGKLAVPNLVIPKFNKIAIALDFSESDEKLLSFALGQGQPGSQYILLHVVESASARLHGQDSDDYETRKDQERMDLYVAQLTENDIKAKGYLGYKHRAKEIVRLVKEVDADMLVVGAHGHTGLKDFIYGETVNSVRHELKIPVLIVHI